ncbi:hypothetical protein FRB90_000223 [Tulasnella sp. 427]|nr:hypothetical protein FRB90_000223 [Tulasnella sp. 427]
MSSFTSSLFVFPLPETPPAASSPLPSKTTVSIEDVHETDERESRSVSHIWAQAENVIYEIQRNSVNPDAVKGSKHDPFFLDGITIAQMNGFLAVSDASVISDPSLFTVTQWKDAISVAELLQLDALRIYVTRGMVKAMDRLDAVVGVQTAIKYRNKELLHKSISRLSLRKHPLTWDEAIKISVRYAVAVAAIREELIGIRTDLGRKPNASESSLETAISGRAQEIVAGDKTFTFSHFDEDRVECRDRRPACLNYSTREYRPTAYTTYLVAGRQYELPSHYLKGAAKLPQRPGSNDWMVTLSSDVISSTSENYVKILVTPYDESVEHREMQAYILQQLGSKFQDEDPVTLIEAAALGNQPDAPWVNLQHDCIVERSAPLSVDEALRLPTPSVVRIAHLREKREYRNGQAQAHTDNPSYRQSLDLLLERKPSPQISIRGKLIADITLMAMLDPDAHTPHSDEDSESVETPEQEGKLGDEHLPELSDSYSHTSPFYEYLPFDSNDLVTVQVDNTLFEISADILRLCAAIQTPITNPLCISGLSGSEFDAFLNLANYKMIRGEPENSLGTWEVVLYVATQLGCQEIRELAIESMNEDVDELKHIPLIQIGLKYEVLEWVLTGFTRLIERKEPLTDEEGVALGMSRVLAIYRCRETLTRNEDGDCRASDLINNEPALKSPEYNRPNDVRFGATADDLPISSPLSTHQLTFIELATESTLWRVSMSVLGATSYFASRVDHQKGFGGKSYPRVDISGEVSKAELDSYLSVANARIYQHRSGKRLGLSFQQWIGALRVATIFGHADARRFIIRFIEPQLTDQNPFDIIDSAKTCNVEHWLMPQYENVAKRTAFPSDEEGRRLGVASLMAVCRLREEAAYKKGKQERPVPKALSSRAKGEWDYPLIPMPKLPKEVAKAPNVGLQVPRAAPATPKAVYGSQPGVTPNSY